MNLRLESATRRARGVRAGGGILAVLLTGCQPSAVLPGEVEDPGELLARAVEGEEPLSRNVDAFTVRPDTISDCPGASPTIAVVDWKARDLAVQSVRIEVAASSAAERKLVSEAGRQGSVSTEAWVTPGHAFFLVDAETGKDLASVEIGAKPCL